MTKREEKRLRAAVQKGLKFGIYGCLCDALLSFAHRMPAEFTDWGVTKTRAYALAMEQARRAAVLKRPNFERMHACLGTIAVAKDWDPDQAAQFLSGGKVEA